MIFTQVSLCLLSLLASCASADTDKIAAMTPLSAPGVTATGVTTGVTTGGVTVTEGVSATGVTTSATTAEGVTATGVTAEGVTAEGVTASMIDMNGTWNQLYSNQYVQLTTEIDWKCIKVYVSTNDTSNEMTFFKKASLHGGPQYVVTPKVHAKLYNDPTKYKVCSTNKTYDIHHYSNATVVITGKNDPSLYVWQRVSEDDDDDDDDPVVDVPRLVVFVKKLGMREQIYVKTYNKTTCET